MNANKCIWEWDVTGFYTGCGHNHVQIDTDVVSGRLSMFRYCPYCGREMDVDWGVLFGGNVDKTGGIGIKVSDIHTVKQTGDDK